MAPIFEKQRRRLTGIAYRMLSSRAEAEDLVQDAWLRWREAPQAALQSAEAWLVTVVTRLCIDRLRQLKVEREHYVGPWLPEPLIEPSPEESLAQQGEVSMAFLVMLERLSPEERAIFLLHEVFEFDYAEIAAIVEKSEAACRQAVSRARERVRKPQARFQIPGEQHQALLEQFVAATKVGTRETFAAMFAPDARYTGDGGAETLQTRRIIEGAERIGRLWEGLSRKFAAGWRFEPVLVNGMPGLRMFYEDALDAVAAFEIEDGKIAALYVIRNRDKIGVLKADR